MRRRGVPLRQLHPKGRAVTRRHPSPPTPEVDEAEAYRVYAAACGTKKRCRSMGHARGDAAALLESTGETVYPYRCPFSSLTGPEHYHNGHLPSPEPMPRMAAVIRWFGEHGFDEGKAQ